MTHPTYPPNITAALARIEHDKAELDEIIRYAWLSDDVSPLGFHQVKQLYGAKSDQLDRLMRQIRGEWADPMPWTCRRCTQPINAGYYCNECNPALDDGA